MNHNCRRRIISIMIRMKFVWRWVLFIHKYLKPTIISYSPITSESRTSCVFFRQMLKTMNSRFTIIDKVIAVIIYGMLLMSSSFLLFVTKSVNDLTIDLYSASIYLLYSIAYTVMIKKKLHCSNYLLISRKKIKSR